MSAPSQKPDPTKPVLDAAGNVVIKGYAPYPTMNGYMRAEEVESETYMPTGSSLTAEELAAIVERKMAGEADPETSTRDGKSRIGGSLPAEGGGDWLEGDTGAGSGYRSGDEYGGGLDSLAPEADRKLAEYTAFVARWRPCIPEEERDQYDKVMTDLLACQKETVDVFKATLARMRR